MNDWKMLKITEEDIENGIRGNSCECPIARALWRAECKGGAFKADAQVRNADDISIEAKNGQTISIVEVHEEDAFDIEEFIEIFDETGRVVFDNFGFRYRINDNII